MWGFLENMKGRFLWQNSTQFCTICMASFRKQVFYRFIYLFSFLYKTNTCFSRHACEDKHWHHSVLEMEIVTTELSHHRCRQSELNLTQLSLKGLFFHNIFSWVAAFLWNVFWYDWKHKNWKLNEHELYLLFFVSLKMMIMLFFFKSSSLVAGNSK